MTASALLLASSLALAGVARAAEPAPNRQVLLLLRVLVYDRNLKARAGEAVRLAVACWADGQDASERNALVSAFQEASREVVVGALPVHIVVVPYRGASDFEARMAAARPTALYACSGLEPAAGDIARVTRKLGILSASGSRQMVESGFALGFVSRGTRASVLVNLSAAKSEGADLDSALLGVAEVMR